MCRKKYGPPGLPPVQELHGDSGPPQPPVDAPVIKTASEEKDLVIIVHESLKSSRHCIEAVKSANKALDMQQTDNVPHCQRMPADKASWLAPGASICS